MTTNPISKTIILTRKQAMNFGTALAEFALANGFTFLVSDVGNIGVPNLFRACLADIYQIGRLLNVQVNLNTVNDCNVVQAAVFGTNLAHRHNTMILAGLRRLYREELVKREKEAKTFQVPVEAVFCRGSVGDYKEDPSAGTVTFRVYDLDVTFDHLATLSEILGTRKINLSSSIVTKGCDTCGHGGYTATPVTCWNVHARRSRP